MNNYPSDEEVSNRYTKIQLAFTEIVLPFLKKELEYKCYRDELFDRLIKGWNIERVKAGYKPLSAKRLATAINMNPFLKSDDGELELIIKTCEKRGNYKFAHYILFPKTK